MERFRVWGSLLILILFILFAPAVETFAATKTLSKIAITPVSVTIIGLNQESRTLSTIAYYTDGTTEDVTNTSTYSTNSNTVATVEKDSDGNKFYKSGTKVGTATITAAYGAKKITSTVTVKAKLTSIAITPAAPKITGNNVLSSTVAVKAYYENGTSATVTSKAKIESDNTDIVTITSYRLKSGPKSGTAKVTATYKEYDVECTSVSDVTVVPTLTKISISPLTDNIIGQNIKGQEVKVTGTYSDGTTQDVTNISTYSTNSNTVATVEQDSDGNKFYKSGTQVGTATITAAYGAKKITSKVTVKAKLTSITITPAAPKITGNNVLSSTVAVKAYYENGTSATVTSKAKIESDNTDIVTITSYRLKSGSKSGTAKVTATYKEYDVECTSVSNVTVVSTLTKISISPLTDSIIGQNIKGQEVKVTGTYSDNTTQDVTTSATFASSSSTVAFVKDGYITSGTKSGKVSITAKYNNKSAVCVVTVIPTLSKISPSITTATINAPNSTGSTIKITATYSDNSTKDVTTLCGYDSSDKNIAYVDVKTLKSGNKSGSAKITVTFENMKTTITVNAKVGVLSISVSPAISRIIGPSVTGQAITVKGDYSDGTQKNITSSLAFSSSDSNIAYVKSYKLVSGKNAGNAIITVKYSSKTANCEVFVKPVVSSLKVSPSAQTIIGKNMNGKSLTITATYADGSSDDVTDWASLSSNDNNIASVKGTIISSGTNYGSAKITASYGGKSASCSVNVPVPPIVNTPVKFIPTKEMEKIHGKVDSISISSGASDVHATNSAGGYVRIVSSFPDGFSLDVSPKTMFNTSNGAIAYVTKDANGNRILMSGNKTGTAKITAVYGGKIVSFYVSVSEN